MPSALCSSLTPAIQRPRVQSKAGCAKSTQLCARYPTCPSLSRLKSRLAHELNHNASGARMRAKLYIGQAIACMHLLMSETTLPIYHVR